jgi:hypothetical protein
MRIELANCEQTLLTEIANPVFKRADIAVTYGLALRSSEARTNDRAMVNRAIIARWSFSALNWIKKQAWKA